MCAAGNAYRVGIEKQKVKAKREEKLKFRKN